ncbi:hypothetical protein MtrunA17_Chr6g0482171 [Medicago truncatula]|uniref:Transmembrane protein n=1 Tax=Medicago truncatula TaxID=3880 RepID=A0A396HNZ3_MEDTR|nr:hypothetical protein MtrunA17_Chr6g0482171 [Medicago truncatula]
MCFLLESKLSLLDEGCNALLKLFDYLIIFIELGYIYIIYVILNNIG